MISAKQTQGDDESEDEIEQPTGRLEPLPTGPWNGQVAFSDTGGGYAYKPGEIVVVGEAVRDATLRFLQGITNEPPSSRPLLDNEFLIIGPANLDVEFVVAELRHQGFQAEPNYVLFHHAASGCGCGCNCVGSGGPHPNPVFANPVFANPVFANPVFANPVFANPVFANPVFANPVFANPVFANAELREDGVRSSSVLPAKDPEFPRPIVLPVGSQRVIVVDTGIAKVDNMPALLSGAINHDLVTPGDLDLPDADGDTYLDPASGHGTFIAGIIEHLVPDRDVRVRSAINSFGYGAMSDIVETLLQLISDGLVDDHTVINLSFGGYADREMASLARAIRRVQQAGAVVVASSGNDGICRHSYPACLPGVVSVGSFGPHGPEPYSNHGNWVRACAPGTSVVSSFFQSFDGAKLPANMAGALDPDEFAEWASWTGTSFAAPIVAAAIVRFMAMTGHTAKAAVERIIDDPNLFRMPGLGTVVNLRPGM